MIISHKLKIIYIRLQKVASTSFESALSKYCGPNDIIAKLGRGNDKLRKSLGYCGPQNFEIIDEDFRFEYKGHDEAIVIKESIPPDIWDSYTKIATIRNPYDRIISKYYDLFRKAGEEKPLTFEKFIERRRRNKPGLISHFLYDPIHIDGKLVVDFYIRYEHLIEDVKKLEMKIACPGLLETMEQFSIGTQFRPKQGTSLYEIYSKYPKAKSIIDEDLYENIDKYELLKDHWPKYKLELEKILDTGDEQICNRI